MSSSENPPATKCHKNCHKRVGPGQPQKGKSPGDNHLCHRGRQDSGEGGNLLAPLSAPSDDYRLIALIHWKNKAFAASHRPGHEPGLRVILGAKTGSVCTKRAPIVHREIAEKGRLEINVRIPTTHLRQIHLRRVLLRQLISDDTAGVAVRPRARPPQLGVLQRGGLWPGRRQDDRDGAGAVYSDGAMWEL